MSRFKFAAGPFLILYCLGYAVVFAKDWPLFVYYPLVDEWYWGASALSGKGPGMAWYGLMANAAIFAGIVTAVIPPRLSERLTGNYLWVFPVGSMLVSVYLLRRFLF